MATNKQPPSGFNIDDAIAEELDDESAGHAPLADTTQKLEQIHADDEDDEEGWGSETRVMMLPDAAAKENATANKQVARLQPLPPGVAAEIDFGDRKFTLGKSLTIIGRVKDVADIALADDDQLSRHHCAIVYADGGFFVEDLESTNGTFIGNKRIKRAPLTEETEVMVGKHVFRLILK